MLEANETVIKSDIITLLLRIHIKITHIAPIVSTNKDRL